MKQCNPEHRWNVCCGQKMKIKDTRHNEYGTQRRYVCDTCGKRQYSYEERREPTHKTTLPIKKKKTKLRLRLAL